LVYIKTFWKYDGPHKEVYSTIRRLREDQTFRRKMFTTV